VSRFENSKTVRHLACEKYVGRSDQDRSTSRTESQQSGLKAINASRVQPGGWLIEEQHGTLAKPGNGQPERNNKIPREMLDPGIE
jgi:hypothetical protein